MKSNLSQYLRGIPQPYKSKIKKLAISKGLEVRVKKLDKPSAFTGKSEVKSFPMNDSNREILQNAIFSVMNDFESTDNGRPNHPTQ